MQTERTDKRENKTKIKWVLSVRPTGKMSWGVNYLTCVNTRFSELRLSRLRTKRIDWKSSWMLALNCSSSIPQVALEYRIRDWTMNLNRYSRAWGGFLAGFRHRDIHSAKPRVISQSQQTQQTMNKHWVLTEVCGWSSRENQYIKQMFPIFRSCNRISPCMISSEKEILRPRGNVSLCTHQYLQIDFW